MCNVPCDKCKGRGFIHAPKRCSSNLKNDGGIWICHTCKTVIGPIVDDDENKCGCDVYEFEYSRYIPDPTDPNRR